MALYKFMIIRCELHIRRYHHIHIQIILECTHETFRFIFFPPSSPRKIQENSEIFYNVFVWFSRFTVLWPWVCARRAFIYELKCLFGISVIAFVYYIFCMKYMKRIYNANLKCYRFRNAWDSWFDILLLQQSYNHIDYLLFIFFYPVLRSSSGSVPFLLSIPFSMLLWYQWNEIQKIAHNILHWFSHILYCVSITLIAGWEKWKKNIECNQLNCRRGNENVLLKDIEFGFFSDEKKSIIAFDLVGKRWRKTFNIFDE